MSGLSGVTFLHIFESHNLLIHVSLFWHNCFERLSLFLAMSVVHCVYVCTTRSAGAVFMLSLCKVSASVHPETMFSVVLLIYVKVILKKRLSVEVWSPIRKETKRLMEGKKELEGRNDRQRQTSMLGWGNERVLHVVGSASMLIWKLYTCVYAQQMHLQQKLGFNPVWAEHVHRGECWNMVFYKCQVHVQTPLSAISQYLYVLKQQPEIHSAVLFYVFLKRM